MATRTPRATAQASRYMRPGISYARRFDDSDPGQLLHSFFEQQSDRHPGATAVIEGEQTVSYAALEARANRIAHTLMHLGVAPGDHVGLVLPRSISAYAAILGILKAGAAYVPLDPEYPAERIEYILRDAAARVVIVNGDTAQRAVRSGATLLNLDVDQARIQSASARRPTWRGHEGDAAALCYIIYTSGSTGAPKGVMVEHHSACNLVRAEGALFHVTPSDRVFQGFSLAFDASIEEIWLAFFAGACLVTATTALMRSGDGLHRFLTERGVTVLSCVPTFLSLLTGELPTLRLLILGGEACPDALVTRWARPGLRMVNTYGPTETTVIATCAELHAHRPVTIGNAIPGYRVYVLDDALQPVPAGTPGEICIGGVGVARGYVGLDATAATSFVDDPFESRADARGRLYRTGDLGRMDADGNIVFLGRRDGQVKLRGFRVELEEIENALLTHASVRAAACAVQRGTDDVQHLVAFVVAKDGEADARSLRAHLLRRLPPYMVPVRFQHIQDLPLLPSGKIDRAALPTAADDASTLDPPRGDERPVQNPAEAFLLAAWQRLFAPQPVRLDDHFFHDLGGHSLLAARLASELRKDPRFAAVSIRDIYEHPTVQSLAAVITETRRPAKTAIAVRDRDQRRETTKHRIAGCIQAAALVPVYSLQGLRWVAPWIAFVLLVANGSSALAAGLWCAAIAVASFPALLAITIAAKWLLLGRITTGRHPLWGWYYLRWWFVQSLVDELHLDYLGGTPLLPTVYRWLGARIGHDVHMTTDHLAAFDVVHVGDGSCIDDNASLLGYTVEDGELVIGRIDIGARCIVGMHAIVAPHAEMEDEARLGDLSFLPDGGRIPAGETWIGSPARLDATIRPHVDAAPPRGKLERAALVAFYVLAVALLPLVTLAGFVPGILLLLPIDPLVQPLRYLMMTPLVGLCFVLVIATEVVLIKWVVAGRVRAGRHRLHGTFYMRYWVMDRLLMISIDVLAPLRATLYLAPWFRMLGARLGRFVELSTASSTTPDLIEISDGGTVADEATLGAPRIEHGWITLEETKLGTRAFVGNSAVVPGGARLGDRSLIGVLSLAPSNPAESARADASWLGSPPFALPRRQASAQFDETRTYRPSRRLVATRACVELARISLPSSGYIIVSTAVATAALAFTERFGLQAGLALVPFAYTTACIGVLAAVAAAKWLLIGRYHPFVHPLWSPFVWRLEFVNALYEFLAAPLALETLQGTPFLPWYQRVLGARVGRRVYAHTTGFLEWDLVQVGDRAALNDDAVLQTHLFEDRMLKASWLSVGADCSIGTGAIVLYDTTMHRGARLDALSLLMKGEELPADTVWVGVPAA